MDVRFLSPGRAPPHEVNAFIEIPQGGLPVKYELDQKSGALFVDRFLHTSMLYPSNYGFIPGTLAEDGDHLDVLIVTHDPTFPGCLVPVRPIGVLDMRDEKGRDQKILAVPDGDPRFREIADLAHLAPHFLAEIRHFFEVYKTLEEKSTEIIGWSGAAAAEQTVREAQERHAASPAR